MPPGPDISQARNTSNKAMRAKGAGWVASIPRIAGARKVRSNPLSVERGICGRTGGKLACRPVLTYRRQGIRAIKPCERREQAGCEYSEDCGSTEGAEQSAFRRERNMRDTATDN